MDFDVQNRTLEERVEELNWKDLILDNIPDTVVMIYCLVAFFATNYFYNVLGGPRRLQKLNMMLIVITALAIVARNLALKLAYRVLPWLITYGINWMIGLISITDVFVLIANAGNVVMLVAHKSEKPREFWKISMCLGSLLMFLVTVVTVNIYSSYYTDSFTLTWRSFVYAVLALFVAGASVACSYYFFYVEKLLSLDWKNWDGEVVYLHFRHELKNAKALAKQAGFNAAMKSAGLITLIIWYQDQQVFHSIILATLAILTTASFFCHGEAREPVLQFLGLVKPKSNRIDPIATTNAYHNHLSKAFESDLSKDDNRVKPLDPSDIEISIRSSNTTPLPQEQSGWTRFLQHLKRCYGFHTRDPHHGHWNRHEGERRPEGSWITTASGTSA